MFEGLEAVAVDGQRQHAVEVRDCLISKNRRRRLAAGTPGLAGLQGVGKVDGRGAWGCRFVAEASEASTKEARPRSGAAEANFVGGGSDDAVVVTARAAWRVSGGRRVAQVSGAVDRRAESGELLLHCGEARVHEGWRAREGKIVQVVRGEVSLRVASSSAASRRATARVRMESFKSENVLIQLTCQWNGSRYLLRFLPALTLTLQPFSLPLHVSSCLNTDW